MRFLLPALSLLALAACQPPAPDPAASGVGFQSYPDYLRNQTAARPSPQGTYSVPRAGAGAPVNSAPVAAGAITSGPITSGPIGTPLPAAAAAAPLPGAAPAPGAPVPGATPSHPGISDEQDFDAVASRETIESDRARIQANRQQYQQVQPTALPPRAEAGPNIVEYAVKATNRLGQPVWKRSGRYDQAVLDRNCARYASPAAAQEEFLRRGGPERDPKNLDPDGDGFACRWDPTPFQTVRR